MAESLSSYLIRFKHGSNLGVSPFDPPSLSLWAFPHYEIPPHCGKYNTSPYLGIRLSKSAPVS